MNRLGAIGWILPLALGSLACPTRTISIPDGGTGGTVDNAGGSSGGADAGSLAGSAGVPGAGGAAGSDRIAGASGSAGSNNVAGTIGSGGLGVAGSKGGGGAPGCSPMCTPTAYCEGGTCKSRFTEYSIGTGTDPSYITSGADGNLWFTTGENAVGIVGGHIGRLTVSGMPTLFPILTANPYNLTVASVGIVSGPDDNVWFDAVASDGKGYISTATTSGIIINYQFSMTYPTVGRVAVGPDGNIWTAITDLNQSEGSNKIEICTTSGSISEQTLPSYSGPYGIVAGSDGNVWFTETSASADVGRLSPTGSLTEFPPSSTARNIALGADGNLWFTEPGNGAIGRSTVGGTIVEFSVPPISSAPVDLAQGPDGNVWFTEGAGNNIGFITPGGRVTEYAAPASPYGITKGPDGNVWFTEPAAGKIVRFLVP
jgi:streptogramin lyase